MPISPAPTFNLASREDTLQAAMDMPFSPLRTISEGIATGFQSTSVGQMVRGAVTPAGNEFPAVPTGNPLLDVINAPAAIRSGVEQFGRMITGQPNPPMDKAAYEASPYYRKQVPWDPGMTEDRAAALATQFDQQQARNYFGQKSPVYSFLGNFIGGAVDPLNYVPIFGEAAHAAAAARFGILGSIGLASSEAALNTAALDLMTAQNRAKFGDDVSWQATINDVAFSALAGAILTPLIHGGIKAFDTLSGRGAVAARDAVQSRAETVPNMAAARDVLNDSVTSMATTGDVHLSPASEATVRSMAADVVANRDAAVADAVARDAQTQIAYHGTPHEFDQFSLAHVDSGEGAQAFGHGLYFAGNREVADFYRRTTTPFDPSVHGVTWRGEPITTDTRPRSQLSDEEAAAKLVAGQMEDGEKSFADAKQALLDASFLNTATKDAIRSLNGADFKQPKRGRVVSVEIPSNDQLLDWNKPISEQSPYVQKALEKVVPLLDPSYQKNLAELRDKITGEVFYNELGNDLGGERVPVPGTDPVRVRNDVAASEALREAGIPGHMYFDMESRNRSEGSRNYVIYDDSKVRIIDDPLRQVLDAFGGQGDHIIRDFASSFDEGARAIFGGLNDVAPRWRALRDAAERGDVAPELDATPELMTALQNLTSWRRAAASDGRKLSEVIKEGMGALDQADGNLSLEAKALIRAFYKTDDFVRSAGRETIAARMNAIIDEAEAIGRTEPFADAEAATKLGILRHVANDDLEANLFTPLDAGTRPVQVRSDRGQPAAGTDRGNAAQGAENGQGGGPSQPSLIPATDFTQPRPDAPPDGLVQATARVGKAEDYKALAAQHGVSEDGSFAEQMDIDQMREAGQLTDMDEKMLTAADDNAKAAELYGKSLLAAANCVSRAL